MSYPYSPVSAHTFFRPFPSVASSFLHWLLVFSKVTARTAVRRDEASKEGSWGPPLCPPPPERWEVSAVPPESSMYYSPRRVLTILLVPGT